MFNLKKSRKIPVLSLFLSIPFLVFIIFYYQFTSSTLNNNPLSVNPSTLSTKIFPQENVSYLSTSDTDLNSAFEYIVITETPVPTPTPTLTPTPLPKPTIITSLDLDRLFTFYSNKESVNKELLKKIAFCESHFNPQAKNDIYAGLFQFSQFSWQNTRRRMGLDPDEKFRFDAEESIKTAAFKIATEGIYSWPNCSK